MKRNSIEIKVWLRRQGFRMVTIKKDLGYKDTKTVWATIEGRENNRRVLSWLKEKGCPDKHLALPGDMEKAA